MSRRARVILDMAVAASNLSENKLSSDEDQPNEASSQQPILPFSPDSTNSIPESQPDLHNTHDYIEDDVTPAADLQYRENCVIGPSDSDTTDLICDVSIKDPTFEPGPQGYAQQNNDSPQPGPSWADQQTLIAVDFDSEPQLKLHNTHNYIEDDVTPAADLQYRESCVIGPSDSDSDSDTSSDTDDSSSSSATDFSSDDSIRDPTFEPDPQGYAQQNNDSPQPGPSWADQQTLIAVDFDSEPLDTLSINTQVQILASEEKTSSIVSPSIQIQPPSVDSVESDYVNTEPSSPNPQKLSRKRKANPASWKRNIIKALKNTGKSHVTAGKSKKNIEAKAMGPVCSDKCKQKCGSEFSFEQRLTIFENYWNTGDLKIQRQFINENMNKIEPKYQYVRVGSTRKNFNHAYYLPKDHKRVRVCKVFFMNTLAISDKTIRTVLKKSNEGLLGLEMEDNRGKHHKHVKLEEALMDEVRKHINSIPRIESHYCRARTKREFIEGGLTIAALHRDYVEKCTEAGKEYVSYKIYYNIFVSDFNISFWIPKKDQCEDCTAFKNVEDKALLQEKYDLHIKEKTLARSEKEQDKAKVNDDYVVCVYDLQAVMPCPKGEVSSFYYISKLNLLNFTVTELGTNKTNCYVWHEGEGARGVNEIGSCVFMFLKDLHDRASTEFDVVFYSDNCCGQQKNKFMLSLYQYAVNKFPKLRSITHKFLIKGHTQNEGDAAHSLIQRNIGNALKSSPVYVPDQYITLIKTAKKKGTPFAVHELTHTDFLDLKCLAIGNYTTSEDGYKIKWADIKAMQVRRDQKNKFYYKTTYESEEYIPVSTVTKKQKPCNIVPKRLYSQKLKVAETKKQGILKLIEKNIVPKYYQSFYESL